jgi:hypothetical protein
MPLLLKRKNKLSEWEAVTYFLSTDNEFQHALKIMGACEFQEIKSKCRLARQ